MIKILTLIGNNFGGSLQAFALQSKIKELGYTSEIVNYTSYFNKKKSIKSIIKSIIYFKRYKKFKKFRDKNFIMTSKYKSLIDDGSVYIVGSDQVWNPIIDFDIRKNFYFDFVKDSNRKNSYAASIGDEKLDVIDENIKSIVCYINNFNYLSVREKSSQSLLNEYTDKRIYNVLDPTLLFDKDEWNKLIDVKYNSNNYLLVYTLGLDKCCNDIINSLCVKKKIKIRDVFYNKRFKYLDKLLNNLGPKEWVSSIASSKFVITNSFHGTVFAIIYHKDFLVITRNSMNNRIHDLLNMLGINGRIFNPNDLKKLNSLDDLPKIDYDDVDNRLKKFRNESENYLIKVLKIDKNI